MKQDHLQSIIAQLVPQGVCVAFSGGADSSLILKLATEEARRVGRTIHAVTFATTLHPSTDLPIARRVAEEMGAHHVILELDEFTDEGILQNPVDRCYRCKKMLFQRLQEYAADQGLKVILDGTNQDDLSVYRPGLKALAELGIRSPLAEAGLTKADVRALARELGISVSDRPSAPCLATRLPYGTRIRRELLDRIEAGEAYLVSQGFAVVRLRSHGDILRIEIPREDFQRFLDLSPLIIAKMHELRFLYVTLDLEGFRSGSMDLALEETAPVTSHLTPSDEVQ